MDIKDYYLNTIELRYREKILKKVLINDRVELISNIIEYIFKTDKINKKFEAALMYYIFVNNCINKDSIKELTKENIKKLYIVDEAVHKFINTNSNKLSAKVVQLLDNINNDNVDNINKGCINKDNIDEKYKDIINKIDELRNLLR